MSREELMPRAAYRWWDTVTIRWSDNDVYGHVNNAVYYHWFDTAVNDWLIAAGLLDIVAGDPIGLVVETQCRYARPIAYPGSVEIGVALARLGISSVKYRLGAFEPGIEEAAAQATFTHVYVDRQSRRPTALPEIWRERLSALA